MKIDEIKKRKEYNPNAVKKSTVKVLKMEMMFSFIFNISFANYLSKNCIKIAYAFLYVGFCSPILATRSLFNFRVISSFVVNNKAEKNVLLMFDIKLVSK